MVAGHVSKDSWSRCETPSMLYGAVRKPCAPLATKPNAASSANGKDSIESTKQRLKKEMISKLDNKGLQLPHESYVAVVQVGKYVFLAIMLPVYLCCFTIPRWFMVNTLSPLLEGIRNQCLSIGRHIVEMSKYVTDLMKGLLEQLIGDALRMSKERGKNIWRHVSRRFNHISTKIVSFSNSLNARFKTRLGKIKGTVADASKKVMERAHHQSDSTNQWIVKKSARIGKKIGSKLLHYFQRVDQAVLTPLMRIVVASFKIVMKVVLFIKNYAIQTCNGIKWGVKKIFRPITVITAKAIKFLTNRTNHFIQWAVNFFLMKKEKALTRFKKFKEIFILPVIRTFAATKFFNRPVIRISGKFFKTMFAVIKRTVKSIWTMVSKFVRKMSSKQRSFFYLAGQYKSVLKGLFESLAKKMSKIQNTLVAIIKLASRLTRYTFSLLKAMFRVAKRYLFALFRISALITSRAIFALHIVIAVLWISSTYGFELARQIGDSMEKDPVRT